MSTRNLREEERDWEAYLDALAARAEHSSLQRVTRLQATERVTASIWQSGWH